MEKENLTEMERKAITEDMIVVADKIAEADLNNKKFLDRMGTKIMLAFAVALGAVGAGIGISFCIGNSSSLPELQNEDDDE